MADWYVVPEKAELTYDSPFQQASFSGTRTALTPAGFIAETEAWSLGPSKMPQPCTQANSVPDRSTPCSTTCWPLALTSWPPDTCSCGALPVAGGAVGVTVGAVGVGVGVGAVGVGVTVGVGAGVTVGVGVVTGGAGTGVLADGDGAGPAPQVVPLSENDTGRGLVPL
jgi:hypothetical protein